MTVSAIENANKGIVGKVWERKCTFVWQTGDEHAAQSITLANLLGALENVIVVISGVTGNPTVTVTLTDAATGAALVTLSAMADGTVHFKQYPNDFYSVLLAGGDVELTVDPSADAGGEAQTLTVEVVLRGL